MSYTLHLPLAAGTVKDIEMPTGKTEPKVALPTWVLPIILTLLMAFVAQLGTSVWWASQMATNQQHMLGQMTEMRDEMKAVRAENQKLSIEIAALKAAQRNGIGFRRDRDN